MKKGDMTQQAALTQLSAITTRCVACHEANRLGIAQ
jgi:cytochrome c553